VTNAELAGALRALASFLDKDPQVGVDDQIRASVSELIGEISKRHARALLDSNLSAITSWMGRWKKAPPKP